MKLIYQYILLAIKVALFFWILFPTLFLFWTVSKIKSKMFLRKDKLLNYLNEHIDEIKAAGGIRIADLKIEKINKGVANLICKLILFFDDGKQLSLVAKKFLPFGSIITFISAYGGPFPKHIPMSIKRRFRQEVNMLQTLKLDGVYVPQIMFVDERQKLILMRYITGTDIGSLLEKIEASKKLNHDALNLFYNCGKGLALLHKKGVSLVSHNDRSRIVEKQGKQIYFVDFELSTKVDYRAWDLAIFIHWIRIKLEFSDKEKARKIEAAFIKGYKEVAPLEQKAIHRHIKDLRIYVSFAKLGMRINRRLKARPSGELK